MSDKNNNFVSFKDIFFDTSEPHRIVSLSDKGLIEFQKMRFDVYKLYRAFIQSYRDRIIVNVSNPYFNVILTLAVALAKKSLFMSSSLTNQEFEEFVDSEDIYITDNLEYALTKVKCFDIEEILSEEVLDDNIEFPDFDAREMLFSVVTKDPENGFSYNTRTLASIEDEINASFEAFAELKGKYIAVCTEKLNLGFFLVHGAFLSFLAKGIMHTCRFMTQQSLASLVSLDYVLITSCEFLKFLDTNIVLPQAKLVCFVGNVVNPEIAVLANQVFGCSVIQFMGNFQVGCFAYREPLVSQNIKLFNGIGYDIDPVDSSLIITDNFMHAPSNNTNLIVEVKRDGFEVIGDRRRLVWINDKKFFLDEIERLVDLLPTIKNSVALLKTEEGTNMPYVCLVVQITQDEKEKICRSKDKSDYVIHIREELQNTLPKELIPRKVRIIDEITFDAEGKVNIGELEKLF